MNHIDVMKQALDALELATTPLNKDRYEVLMAIKALRAAIAQPESEPVARVVRREIEAGHDTPASHTFDVKWLKIDPFNFVGNLYAAPVGYVPLSDEAWQKIADITGAIITRPMKDAIERAVRGET